MMSRRFFMAVGGATASIPKAFAQSDKYHFTLGVASGCPRPDGIVLWTRLARQPLQGGGMGRAPVDVAWELAEDDRMQRIVRKGTVTARADSAHSVHVEVDGLEPDR